MPAVTAIYAGLLGLIALVVGFLAGRLRGQLNVAVGDGGNRDLLSRSAAMRTSHTTA